MEVLELRFSLKSEEKLAIKSLIYPSNSFLAKSSSDAVFSKVNQTGISIAGINVVLDDIKSEIVRSTESPYRQGKEYKSFQLKVHCD